MNPFPDEDVIIAKQKAKQFDDINEEYRKILKITNVADAADAINYFFARLRVIIDGPDLE